MANSLHEVVHNYPYDLIFNKYLFFQGNAALKPLIANGISSWPLYLPYPGRETPNLYVNDLDNPKYLAKRKVKFPHQGIFQEFEVAARMHKVLGSANTTRVVNKFGIASISVVEPLAALINRSLKDKVTIYPFIAGKIFFKDDDFLSGLGIDQTNALIEQLRKIFFGSGIQGGELALKQLIETEVDGERVLYVIDLEGYSITEGYSRRSIKSTDIT